MTKSEAREVNKARTLVQLANQTVDRDHAAATLALAARTMGTLVRSAMTARSIRELGQVAAELGLNTHRDYIV